MYVSQLFTRTSKETSADAASLNADLLTRAGFVHKTMAGVYSYLPLGLVVLRKIETIVREEMNAIGGQEILMSALSPKENWQKTNRWQGFDALFKLPAAGDSEYALNPTHEEIVTPLVREFVSSYKDLPFGCYQIQTKFRNEPRAKSGVLRGREFLMKDLYSFHTDQEDLDAYYEVVHGAYDKIFDRLGLTDITYYTFASGGSFSQFSHEFQVVLPQGEDTIYISEEAEKKGMRIAINKEIFERGKTKCPVTGGTTFREVKASEVPISSSLVPSSLSRSLCNITMRKVSSTQCLWGVMASVSQDCSVFASRLWQMMMACVGRRICVLLTCTLCRLPRLKMMLLIKRQWLCTKN